VQVSSSPTASGQGEVASRAQADRVALRDGMATLRASRQGLGLHRLLKRWSTDELETAIYSGSLDNIQRYLAERIISERERAPDRRLARRSYNAAWAYAFSLGTFIVALIILWLMATGNSLP
jgi:hypothetical protein